MQHDTAKALHSLGLSENETKIYLAGLVLGPATAQHLAAKAIVTRPTTYIVIESLTKLGLMSSIQRGKKKLFVASKPSRLSGIMEARRREIEQNEATIKKIVALLESSGGSAKMVPANLFEGNDATYAAREDVAAATGEVRVLAPQDATLDADSPAFMGGRGTLSAKGRKVKSLFASDRASAGQDDRADRRRLPAEKLPVKSELLIAGGKAYFSNPEDRRFSLHLNDRQIVATLTAMFDALWDGAKSA